MDASRTDALQGALEFLDGRRDRMVAMLRRWCDQNSGSHHLAGLARMSEILVEDFQELDTPHRRVSLPRYSSVDDQGQTEMQSSGDLLRWDHDEDAPHRVLLMIHYDTVYPPQPFQMKCDLHADGILIGPGTADAKGGLLVMREALLAVRRFGLDEGLGWTAVANPDEELGSPASAAWIAESAGEFDFGLLFEPTLPDGALVSARKGSGNFTLVVHGRSAHAGRNPEQGRNAVVHLCRLLAEIDDLNSDRTRATVNVARATGGGPLNRVPDLAVGRFNVRTPDAAGADWVLAQLREIVERYNASEGLQVVLEGQFGSPPKQLDVPTRQLQQRVEAAAAEIGRPIRWRTTGGACDGSKLAAAGLPNIDTLGPTGDLLHSPKEWVDTRTLVPAAQTVVLAIAQYAAEIRQRAAPRT